MATRKGTKKATGGKRGGAAKKGMAAKKAAKKGPATKKGPAAKRAPAKRRAAARPPAAPPPLSILDHIGIPVRDYAKSKAFYIAALAPLGVGVLMEFPGVGGFGAGNKPELWIGEGRVTDESYWRPEHRAGMAPVHVAIVAKDRAAVDAFHAAALAAGGVDHGAPGLRPEYHPGYYGAFVLDPDGNNIEAVHHTFR
jgi:catechol 2,3-dioxygenase-like lactoylglutathione lyase family enzyme